MFLKFWPIPASTFLYKKRVYGVVFRGPLTRGGLPYEGDGDARRKIRINTLKETNLGVAPALFKP